MSIHLELYEINEDIRLHVIHRLMSIFLFGSNKKSDQQKFTWIWVQNYLRISQINHSN